MKTTIFTFKPFVLLVVMCVALSSCSSDDDNPIDTLGNKELLLGKWFVSDSSGEDELTDCEKTSFILYRDNGTASAVINNEFTDGECIAWITGELSYELTTNTTIKFTNLDDGDSFTSTIMSLTATEMKLKDFLIEDGIITFTK